ncbi:hypothetical protein FGIG_11049 [Fasciola gigantica]|uniref:C2H2-type domain-containing protein n=1 Tax=Fasciola gigantica TaxID=46835 RepID=A0A504YF30_FASGI|nr:hypothetical protein FGIG_11049 [Fasciola gigantica]
MEVSGFPFPIRMNKAVLPLRTQNGLSVVRSNDHLAKRYELVNSASTRVPWISYYFNTDSNIQRPVQSNSPCGLVVCPTCSQHFPNHRILHHFISHLLLDELYVGSLLPFEFCPDCLSSPSDEPLSTHKRTHWHVRSRHPADLLDGCYVCPICEVRFSVILKFAIHLYEKHVFRDSPYVCPVCYSFHGSKYYDLLNHFTSAHAFTNDTFCPYCLKYFELPLVSEKSQNGLHMFRAHKLYEHVRRHWNDMTYRCESCRLDFVYRKDQRIHEYLYHCGVHPAMQLDKPALPDDHADNTQNRTASQLFLYYSNQMRAIVPRLSLKCFECGETLRYPIHRHFSLTVQCPACKFISSCSVAVNWHWCHVHAAPPIPQSSLDLGVSRSWERCITSFSKPIGFDTKSGANLHDRCGSLITRMRRCKHKHAPPGLEYRGVLRCPCGFVTILGNQMARHLSVRECRFQHAYLDRSSRLRMFRVVNRSKVTVAKSRSVWRKKLSLSPLPLQSVGLCCLKSSI